MNSLIVLSIFLNLAIDCNAVEVKTSSGVVRGQTIEVYDQKLNQFLGIPFAEPPIGDLRFAKPKPLAKPLADVIDGTKIKDSCFQFAPSGFDWSSVVGPLPLQSEDCLYLNIWSHSQSSAKLKPVMFWIYGGAFLMGSIFQKGPDGLLYNGSILATGDVVVVATNYRVGAFGFLYGNDTTAPGNAGFFDQNLALKWTRDNIHLFGGDKDQITIFGQSAGGFSVSAHLLSPLSKGLFKRAIMQSGGLMFNKDRAAGMSPSEALARAQRLARDVNCAGLLEPWLSCLKKADARQIIVKYQEPFMGALIKVWPVFGTEFLPEITAQQAFDKGNFNKDLDVMAGVTKDDGSVMAFISFVDIFGNNGQTKDNFKTMVAETNKFSHNIPIDRMTEHYLKNVDDDDKEAIKWRFFDYYGDFLFICPTYRFAKRYAEESKNKSRVFFYELTYSVQHEMVPAFGVAHMADVPILFGKPIADSVKFAQQDVQFSNTFIEYWTNFAKHGSPDNFGTWKPMLTGGDDNRVKDLTPERTRHFSGQYSETCDGVWDDWF